VNFLKFVKKQFNKGADKYKTDWKGWKKFNQGFEKFKDDVNKKLGIKK